MTLLAEGALRVSSYSVAKQATSLPSSSKLAAAETAAPDEAEGGGFEDQRAAAGDSVRLRSNKQPLIAETAQEQGEAQAAAKEARAAEELAEAEKLQQARLEKITEELNDKLNENLSLRFGHDENSGEDFFQLVEKDTGDVVRQFPPQSLLDFREKFKDFAGLIFNQEG